MVKRKSTVKKNVSGIGVCCRVAEEAVPAADAAAATPAATTDATVAESAAVAGASVAPDAAEQPRAVGQLQSGAHARHGQELAETLPGASGQ